MLVNTHRLFTTLLPRLRITTVCDVGSMNGAEATTFSAAVPHCRIYAFEPNPHNFQRMAARQAFFQQRNIRLVPAAATNYDGAAEFFLVKAPGMGSLYRRTGEWASGTGPTAIDSVSAVVRVTTTRLDSFLLRECRPGARMAVWIDTEGAAYEVIEGLADVARQVQLLHVEVETTPCIAAQQKLYPQVLALLRRQGFTELATDQAPGHEQFNALFVRSDLSGWRRLQVAVCVRQARVRFLLVRAALALCPRCVRAYQRLRRSRS